MNRGVATLDHVNNVVLDEADEMLNMGFSESINAIFEGVPQDRNTLLFSATMSKEIEKIARGYLHNHKEIVVGSRNEGAENVNHIFYLVHAKDKYLALKRIVDYHPKIFAIIFCRTKIETQEIADKLIHDGYNAGHSTATSRKTSATSPCRNSASISPSCSWPPMWLHADWMLTTSHTLSITDCPTI